MSNVLEKSLFCIYQVVLQEFVHEVGIFIFFVVKSFRISYAKNYLKSVDFFTVLLKKYMETGGGGGGLLGHIAVPK